jgi:hypothetical protein
MTMKLLTAATLVLLSTGLANAAWTGEQFAKTYTDQGYTRVEVKLMPNQAKVEAFKAGTKLEVIHDIETGAVLKREETVARVGENTGAGVFVRNDDRRGRGWDDDSRHSHARHHHDDDDHYDDDRYDDDDHDDDGRRGRGRGRD